MDSCGDPAHHPSRPRPHIIYLGTFFSEYEVGAVDCSSNLFHFGTLCNALLGKVATHRLSVIFLFGLVHGLGFASALEALFPTGDWGVKTLFLFNVGIELGQLAVLLIALLLFGWLRSDPNRKDQVYRFANLAIAGTGLYWFLQRILA